MSDNAGYDTGLSGDVPAGISNLAFLQELHLRNNRLSGGLAGLGGIPQLKKLDVSVNKFTGNVPPELGNLAGEEVVGVVWELLVCVISENGTCDKSTHYNSHR